MQSFFVRNEDPALEHALAVKLMLSGKMFHLEMPYTMMTMVLNKRGLFNMKGIENPMKELKDAIYSL
jgi:hypothetical protein